MRAYWLVVNSLIGDAVEVGNSRDVTGSSGNGSGGLNMTWGNRKKVVPTSGAPGAADGLRPMVSGFPVWIRWQSHNGPD